jgi:hypothetical protein
MPAYPPLRFQFSGFPEGKLTNALKFRRRSLLKEERDQSKQERNAAQFNRTRDSQNPTAGELVA